jgi:hypothetical protein
MDSQTPQRDYSEAVRYVKSLKDAVKRRYAMEYLGWIQAGRIGAAPGRGALPPAQWKAVSTNLDTLA